MTLVDRVNPLFVVVPSKVIGWHKHLHAHSRYIFVIGIRSGRMFETTSLGEKGKRYMAVSVGI